MLYNIRMQLSRNMKKMKQLKMRFPQEHTCRRLKYLEVVNYKLSRAKGPRKK